MLKDLGYLHTFPQSLAQINIKSKPRRPVKIIIKKNSGEDFKTLEKSLDKEVGKVRSTDNRTQLIRKK